MQIRTMQLTRSMREQRRFSWKDRHDFQTRAQPGFEVWAAVIKQWEGALAGAIGPTANGAGEVLRLQVA